MPFMCVCVLWFLWNKKTLSFMDGTLLLLLSKLNTVKMFANRYNFTGKKISIYRTNIHRQLEIFFSLHFKRQSKCPLNTMLPLPNAAINAIITIIINIIVKQFRPFKFTWKTKQQKKIPHRIGFLPKKKKKNVKNNLSTIIIIYIRLMELFLLLLLLLKQRKQQQQQKIEKFLTLSPSLALFSINVAKKTMKNEEEID